MQGLGGGMILSVTNIIIGDLVPLQERGVVSGVLGLLVHNYSSDYPVLILRQIVGAISSLRAPYRWCASRCWSMALDLLSVHSPIICKAAHLSFKDLNLPISGLTVVLVLVLLKLPTPPGTINEKLAKMDWMSVTMPV